ncbi:MAG: hypothetical protein D6688_04970 [Alphaproteobacteria bacterium]|nr:MAG: hypothetical protein D6688_04970 [Alphaproteobacteria bacterium]
MENEVLLGLIWSGAVEALAVRETPLGAALDALLVVPTVVVVTKDVDHEPALFLADDEILPGCTVADLLAEELDIYAPEGAVVLVQSREAVDRQDISSERLGRELGGLLVALAGYRSTDGCAAASETEGRDYHHRPRAIAGA